MKVLITLRLLKSSHIFVLPVPKQQSRALDLIRMQIGTTRNGKGMSAGKCLN